MIPSCDKIELLVYNSLCDRTKILVPNVSFGLLTHEADLILMSKSGYLTEIEIKRSWSDFKADFKKSHDHTDPLIKYFYYCVHSSFSDKVIAYINDNNIKCDGVYTYTDKCLSLPTKCGTKYPRGRKLDLEEQKQLMRLSMFRLWRYKQKLIKYENI